MNMKDRIKRWICGGERKRLQEEALTEKRAKVVIRWNNEDQEWRCWISVDGKGIATFFFKNLTTTDRAVFFYNGNETVDDNYCGTLWKEDIDTTIVKKEEQ